MTTRERAEAIVQDLEDKACEGDVLEVMVFVRDASGRMQCAFATADTQQFIDDVHAATADIDTEAGAPRTRRWLN